jgi:hypothetical protein
MKVLHRSQRKKYIPFWKKKNIDCRFVPFLVIKNLPGLDPELNSAKRNYQVSNSVNLDPQQKVRLAFLIEMWNRLLFFMPVSQSDLCPQYCGLELDHAA